MLQYCTEHVQRQWHDTINRVKCILYNVDYEDSDFQAEISSIRKDEAPTGLSNYFEAAVDFLLSTNLV